MGFRMSCLAKLRGVEGLRHGDSDDISVDGSRWWREWLAMYLFFGAFSEGVVIFLSMAWYILSLFFGILSLFFGLKETFVNKCDANQVLYHIRLYTKRMGLWQLMLYCTNLHITPTPPWLHFLVITSLNICLRCFVYKYLLIHQSWLPSREFTHPSLVKRT